MIIAGYKVATDPGTFPLRFIFTERLLKSKFGQSSADGSEAARTGCPVRSTHSGFVSSALAGAAESVGFWGAF